jgi:hypothetical protein
MTETDPTPSVDIRPGQPYAIDRFHPEDARGVARLFRAVYGEGYPVRTYVEPDLLIRENKARRVISTVARTARGDIVGHNALFNSAAHPGTYESGAGVVHATYRGGKGIFGDMVVHGLDLAASLPNVDAVFGESVSNHPYSQKLMTRLNFPPRALEVDLMPAAAYEKEASATGRVAAFLAFRTVRANPHRVYLPKAYTGELAFFYEDLEDRREFILSESVTPNDGLTDMRPQVFDFAAVARVAVHSAGRDFNQRMDALEEELRVKAVIVIQVWLNLGEPWVGQAVDTLKARGYFLGGVLPRWFGTDGLLMQKITKPPDWDGIVTSNPRFSQMLAIVHADWQRTKEEKNNAD